MQQGFHIPHCKVHTEQPVTHLCFQHTYALVCAQCLNTPQCCAEHLSSTMDVATFVHNVEESSSDLTFLEEKTTERYSELTELASKVKTKYTKED